MPYNYRRISMAGSNPEEGRPRECVRMWRDPDWPPARPYGGTLRQNVSEYSCWNKPTETPQTLQLRTKASPVGAILQQESSLTDSMHVSFLRSWQTLISLKVPSVLCIISAIPNRGSAVPWGTATSKRLGNTALHLSLLMSYIYIYIYHVPHR
jgi:hypothetical protein